MLRQPWLRNMPGLFVTFEGCEGVGKSTHVAQLAERFRAENYRVRTLREPGGTPLGEEIRAMLKHSTSPLHYRTELLLFNASRAQLVDEVVRPALAQGELVLCDRFYDSSIAYQVYGRGLPLAEVEQIIGFAINGLQPDITFFIDAPPEVGMSNRAHQSKRQIDRFEDEAKAFHQRVYGGFQALAVKEEERIRVIPYLPNDLTKMQGQMYTTIKQTFEQRNP